MSEDERAIRALIDEWMDASRAGDTERVLGLMTDDVLFSICGREPFGKQEFRAASESMRGHEVDGKADVLEVDVLGDIAWIRNRLAMTITPPNGEPIHRSGYTLTLLKKGDDGRWRLFRDANLVI